MSWIGALHVVLTSLLGVDFDAPSLQVSDRRAQPNIMIILVDDLGVDMVGAYGKGADLTLTPYLDALARQGVLFRNAWTNPVCSPTRATIQTGRYSFRHGIGAIINYKNDPYGWALQPEETTLPELLSLVGYSNGAIGKWHLGNDSVGGDDAPNVAGYAHFEGPIGNLNQGENYFYWTKTTNGMSATTTKYATSDVVDSALSWIGTAQEPWLCYVAFNAPHAPWHEPPAHLHSQNLIGLDPSTNPVPFYRAMVEALDGEIDRMLSSLDPSTYDDTVVIFLGDNGTPRECTVAPFDPEHAKGTVYDGGINVPLIISGPVVPQSNEGSECLALVNGVDVFETVTEIAGIDTGTALPQTAIDGVSMLAYLKDAQTPSLRSIIYSEHFSPNGESPPTQSACPSLLPMCQPTIAGSAGPGAASLSMCGQPLFGGNQATLYISGGLPSTWGYISVTDVTAAVPLPVFGGVAYAQPPQTLMPIQLDAQGTYQLDILGGVIPREAYYQAILYDSALTQGYSITNAIRVEVYGQYFKAIRDIDGYKLIVNDLTCEEEFYDLTVDPFEQLDLLQGTLTATEQAHYDSLRFELDQLSP